MAYVFFSISAYIFMRAFEVVFADDKEAIWFKRTVRIIGSLVLYTAIAAMILFYFSGVHLLGFNPK